MKKALCSLAALLLLLLSACGAAPKPTPSTTAAPPSVSTTATPEPTATPLPYTNPLSGEGMETDLGGARPWAIMINNLDKAQPQCGVSAAEIIYEIPAEGGITRMLAIFSDISEVGPIGSMRSIRPYYADAALAYDAILVHAGGSETAYDVMRANGQEHLDGVLGNYGGDTFYRDKDRLKYGMEHSLFATGEKLIAAAEGQSFPMEHEGGERDYGLVFSSDAAGQCGGEAQYVGLRFNSYKTTDFSYDKSAGLYTAHQYGGVYTDGSTGEDMTFANLLVLYTDISVLDDEGRLSVRLTGSGDGLFVCGGASASITWERGSGTEPFRYYLEDGSRLRFGPGHTYIGVMSSYDGSVTFEEE